MPIDHKLNIEKGKSLLASGQVQEGLRLLGQSLPHNASAQFRIVEFMLDRYFEEKIDPMLQALLSRQRFSEAVDMLSDLEKMVVPSPDYGDHLGGIGWAYQRIGVRYAQVGEASGLIAELYKKAISCWETALIHIDRPSQPRQNLVAAHTQLAVYFAERQQLVQAQHHLEKAAEIEPQNSETWWFLYNVHGLQNNMSECQECLEKAAQLGHHAAVSRLRETW